MWWEMHIELWYWQYRWRFQSFWNFSERRGSFDDLRGTNNNIDEVLQYHIYILLTDYEPLTL